MSIIACSERAFLQRYFPTVSHLRKACANVSESVSGSLVKGSFFQVVLHPYLSHLYKKYIIFLNDKL